MDEVYFKSGSVLKSKAQISKPWLGGWIGFVPVLKRLSFFKWVGFAYVIIDYTCFVKHGGIGMITLRYKSPFIVFS